VSGVELARKRTSGSSSDVVSGRRCCWSVAFAFDSSLRRETPREIASRRVASHRVASFSKSVNSSNLGRQHAGYAQRLVQTNQRKGKKSTGEKAKQGSSGDHARIRLKLNNVPALRTRPRALQRKAVQTWNVWSSPALIFDDNVDDDDDDDDDDDSFVGYSRPCTDARLVFPEGLIKRACCRCLVVVDQ